MTLEAFDLEINGSAYEDIDDVGNEDMLCRNSSLYWAVKIIELLISLKHSFE